jgi:hypothetical protein
MMEPLPLLKAADARGGLFEVVGSSSFLREFLSGANC